MKHFYYIEKNLIWKMIYFNMKKVAMIGVGKLGQDCAEIMALHYDVVGYDVEQRNPTFPMKDTIEEAVKDRDFIFIAAPTPHDPMYGGEAPTSHLPNKDFDYTIVTNILNEVNKYVNKNQLVILISTVLPGTVRNHLEPCITNARFIYNPYLIAMGTIKWDMVNPEMVIIGTEDGSLTGDAKELIDFYKVFMANDPRYEVGTWDEAESIKIFYNTFISAKLALVNMIQDVAETNGNINVDVVTQALAKSTHRIMGPAYMKAGLGDAGACHPRDNIALRYLADRLDLRYDLFDSIMTAREVQAERMALRCLKNGKNITIIGKAYKPKVPYTNGSASMLVGYYIEKHGGNVNYYDKNTGDLDLKLNWTEVYLIGYWEGWVKHAVNDIKLETVIIDPWRKINLSRGGEIIHYGDTRQRPKFQPYPTTAPHMKFIVTSIWPELKATENEIHIIPAEVGSDVTFMSRPTESIVSDILEAYKNGSRKFFFCKLSETVMPYVIGKIHRIANLVSHVIDSRNLYYVCGSPNAQEVYDKIYENEVAKGTYWKSKISVLAAHTFQYYSQHNYHAFNNIIDYEIKEKSKDFLCFNKVPRKHRVKLLEKMLAYDYVKRGYYSFEGADNDWVSKIDTMHPKFANIKQNKDIFPLRLNITAERPNPADLILDDIKYFDDSYFSIVTETVFDIPANNIEDCLFMSEKTYKCFAMKHPFVMMSRPHTLAELRKMGYRTFSPMIDESYDTIENDNERFHAIWKEIDRLLQKTPEEWVQWQTQIKEIVDYNHIHFYVNVNHSESDAK